MDILKVAYLCIVIIGHDISATLIKLTCEDIRQLVDGHNNRRLLLAQGKIRGQPAANYMRFLVWDKELAEKAAGWAVLGRYTHNPDKTIGSNRFKVGENLAWVHTTNPNFIWKMDSPLSDWWSELNDFQFGVRQTSKVTGHYTQMAWSNTTQLGCALDKSRKGKFDAYYLVCNYGPRGNMNSHFPYKKGSASRRLVCGFNSNCKQKYGPDCPAH